MLVCAAGWNYWRSMAPKGSGRFLSVDFLRGATVAFMIVANNPGDTGNVYRELIHAKWHGWTAVDFIFPVFLFIVGMSVALAVRRDSPSGRSPWPGAFRRAAVLFALGLLVNGFPFFNLESIRIPGVLQRIAVVYLAVLWLHLKLENRAAVMVVAIILGGYWLLWAFVPVPGLGYPTLDYQYNLEGWLDQMLMRGHIWEYDTTWDPEGILSTLPCVAMALMGALCGRWLKNGEGARWTAVFLLGLCLHLGGIAWNDWFPINKVITTSSFVLFVGGFAVMLTAVAHRLLDGARAPGAWTAPFLALGRNALFIYVLSQLLTQVLYVVKPGLAFMHGKSLHFWLFDGGFAWMGDRFAASLCWALGLLALLTLLAMAMSRRGMVVKL